MADDRRQPGRPQPLHIRGVVAVAPRHRRPQLGADQRQPAHPGAADADEVQPPVGPGGHARTAARTSSAMRRDASGLARAAEAADIAARRSSSWRRASISLRQPIRLELLVADRHRGARLGHPGGVALLVAGGGVRVGDEDRRPPGRRQLEDRAARASQHQVAGGEAVAEVGLVGEQRVALVVRGGGEPLLQRREVARPAQVDDVEVAAGALGQRRDRALVDRAGALAAADDEQAARPGGDAEALPRRGPVGRQHGRRHRPPGERVAAAVAAGDREGEADPPRRPRQQPVGEAEVAVGLGQDQRDARQHGGDPGRAGDEAAAAHHHVGPAAPQHPRRRADRGQRLDPRHRRAQAAAAVDPAHLDEVDLIAGGGHQVGLDPLARAEEGDLGAASPKLVGDRHGRHDVAGRSPGRHQHSYAAWTLHRSLDSFLARARARPRRRAVCQRGRSPRGRR